MRSFTSARAVVDTGDSALNAPETKLGGNFPDWWSASGNIYRDRVTRINNRVCRPKGRLQFGGQYSYLTRDAWSRIDGQPEAIENMIFSSFRYYLLERRGCRHASGIRGLLLRFVRDLAALGNWVVRQRHRARCSGRRGELRFPLDNDLHGCRRVLRWPRTGMRDVSDFGPDGQAKSSVF